MKKTFILLAIVLGVAVFGSCTKSDEKPKNDISSQEQNTSSKTSNNEETYLVFSTKDLDGNIVTNDIFKNYDVTLVNIWGTFCGPCKAELPDLEAAYNVYAKKNCNVIALTSDLFEGDTETLNLAKEIWKDSGCSFKALESVDSFLSVYEKIAGVPTSFFVDKAGKIIKGSFHTGRLNKAGFEQLFEKALNAVK